MKTLHLLRVAEGPESYGEILRAAGQAGLRCGWLEHSDPVPPSDLGAAAELGVLRAVAVGPAGTVVVKPRRGQPVLKDLLREHFRGCALVLLREPTPLREPAAAPALSGQAELWRLSFADGSVRTFSTEEFIAALRRPSPWPSS